MLKWLLSLAKSKKDQTGHRPWPFTRRLVASDVYAEAAASLRDRPERWAMDQDNWDNIKHDGGQFLIPIPADGTAATTHNPVKAEIWAGAVKVGCTRRQAEELAKAVSWWLGWHLHQMDHPLRTSAIDQPDNTTPPADNETPATDAETA